MDNLERDRYTRQGVTYKVGDIIKGSILDELSGHNSDSINDNFDFILIQEPLNNFKDDIYNRNNVHKIYPDNIDDNNLKLDNMKENFNDLPPIPHSGDGLRRIVAAKELGYNTILMWKKIEK